MSSSRNDIPGWPKNVPIPLGGQHYIAPVIRHHIWCNYGMGRVEDCRQCKRFNELYPENGLDPVQLGEKYFPDAIRRTNCSPHCEKWPNCSCAKK